MSYVPKFKCPYCTNVVESKVTNMDAFGGVGQAYLGICGCPESLKAAEDSSRLAVEARKRKLRSSS